MIVLQFIMNNQFMLGLLIGMLLFVPWKARRPFFWIRFVVLVAGAICLSNFVPSSLYPYTMLIDFVAIGILIMVCFDCNIDHGLFAATGAYCIQHITSKLVYLIYNVWFYACPQFCYENYSLITVLLLLVTNLVICTPLCVYSYYKIWKYNKMIFDNPIIIISTAIFLSAAVFLSLYVENALTYYNYYIRLSGYICLNSFCILFAALVLFINFLNSNNKQLKKEKDMLEFLLKKDKLQYEQAKLNMEKVNIRYHDIKQQKNLIMDKSESEKFDKEIKELKALYYTGNETLDILLYDKATICNEENIQFICSAEGQCLSMLSPYHTYSLLGNAIDNAIECLKAVVDPEKKIIRLDIGRHGKMAVIRIENYFEGKLVIDNGIPKTTKGDAENHGFGIKSIKNIVESNNGVLNIDSKDNIFNLTIMLPCKDSE